MALKILGVPGVPLLPTDGDVEQDFLMVNHPVFPFANVADYEAVSQAIAASPDGKPDAFFAKRIRPLSDGSPDLADPVTGRTLRTLASSNAFRACPPLEPGGISVPASLSDRQPLLCSVLRSCSAMTRS